MQKTKNKERYEIVEDAPELMTLLRYIFDEAFMQKYTNFDEFNGFCYSSAVIVNWNAPRLIYNAARLDDFIRESTTFHSFDEMVRCAADLKVQHAKET